MNSDNSLLQKENTEIRNLAPASSPKAFSKFVCVTVPVFSLIMLFLTGVIGVGRGEDSRWVTIAGGVDLQYLYAAGESWLNLESPYNPKAYQKYISEYFDKSIPGVFAYPPQIFPVCLILAIGTIQTAKILMLLFNLASLIVLTFLTFLIFDHVRRPSEHKKSLCFCLSTALAFACIVGNPFASHVVWMGQTTLLTAVFSVGAWYAMLKNKEITAGILFGLCTIKPQVALFFLLWLVLDRKWRVIAIAGITVVCCSAWPMYTSGIIDTWTAWAGSIFAYQNDWQTDLTFKHVFGVRSLLLQFGGSCPSLVPVALIILLILFRYRNRFYQDILPGVFFSISLSFVYAHDYDLAACAIIATPLIFQIQSRPVFQIVAVVSSLFLFFPQRIWIYLGFDWAARSREVALIVLTSLLFFSMSKHSSNSSSHIGKTTTRSGKLEV